MERCYQIKKYFELEFVPRHRCWLQTQAQQRLQDRRHKIAGYFGVALPLSTNESGAKKNAKQALDEAVAEMQRASLPCFFDPLLAQRVAQEFHMRQNALRQGGLLLLDRVPQMIKNGARVATINFDELRSRLQREHGLLRGSISEQSAGPPYGVSDIEFNLYSFELPKHALQAFAFKNCDRARWVDAVVISRDLPHWLIVPLEPRRVLSRTLTLTNGRTVLRNRCLERPNYRVGAAFCLESKPNGYNLVLPSLNAVLDERVFSFDTIAECGAYAYINDNVRFETSKPCRMDLVPFEKVKDPLTLPLFLNEAERKCLNWQQRACLQVQKFNYDAASVASLCEPLRTHATEALEVLQRPKQPLKRPMHTSCKRLSRRQQHQLASAAIRFECNIASYLDRTILRLYAWELGVHFEFYSHAPYSSVVS